MTSSNSAASWTPAELGGPPAANAPAAAFTRFAAPPPAPEAASAPDWLRSLAPGDDGDPYGRAALEQKAWQRGREEGARQEAARAEERMRAALSAVAKVAAQLDTIAAEFAHDRDRDVHGLAVAVARHIVQRELSVDPAWTAELVGRALRLLPLDSLLEIRMNPQDLAVLGEAVAQARPAGRHVRLEWIADPAIERGGFLVESPQRIVDGRPDVALRTLYERLGHD